MAIDPSTPTTLYIGTLGGGVFDQVQTNAELLVAPVYCSGSVPLPETASGPTSGSCIWSFRPDGGARRRRLHAGHARSRASKQFWNVVSMLPLPSTSTSIDPLAR